MFDVDLEYGIRETINEALVMIFDKKSGVWVSAVEINDVQGEKPDYEQGGGLMQKGTPTRNPKSAIKKGRPKAEAKRRAEQKQARDQIREALNNAGAFRFAASGFAIDVEPPAGHRFNSAEDAAVWLRKWFLDKQNNFISAQGTVIGVESLRARQTHTLKFSGRSGVNEPTRFDGDYFFTRVRHIIDESGYRCEFSANRVMEVG
jgi:hypothetical protein